jgi:hypothetical protein
MANLAGVSTYTVFKKRKLDSSVGTCLVTAKLTIGDGASTYPAGGIPYAGANLGLPVVVETMWIADCGNGDTNMYKLDIANQKIRVYVQDGTTKLYGEAASGSYVLAATNLTIIALGY